MGTSTTCTELDVYRDLTGGRRRIALEKSVDRDRRMLACASE